MNSLPHKCEIKNRINNLNFFFSRSNFRRRTLKNRGYAASCRIKRLEQKGDLEQEKGKEFKDLDFVQEDNGQMREEIEGLHKKFEALKRFAQQKKIGIPPELLDQY